MALRSPPVSAASKLVAAGGSPFGYWGSHCRCYRMLSCPDFPFQGPGFAIRLHIELLSERFLASLVLMDGRRSIAGETVEAHQGAMGTLAGGIRVKRLSRVGNPCAHFVVELAIGDQGVEGPEIQLTKALAFLETPFLVPALEKPSAIDLQRATETFCIDGATVFGSDRSLYRLLEFQDVDTDVSIRRELHPAVAEREDPIHTLDTVDDQAVSQVPQGLA